MMIQQLREFSVHNHFVSRLDVVDHPLSDLLPDDFDHGWSVARNPIKPLNHIDFLKGKEKLVVELNLHNQYTPPNIFDANYELLAKHQAGTMSTASVIKHLTLQLQNAGGTLTERDVIEKLREYATIHHMEFHPSDVCNLICNGCTYGHDDRIKKPLAIHFPFDEIHKIAQLKPRSMVITGGGESTLYRDGRHHFQDAVNEVCDTNPGIALALVTNGTYKPAGDWPNSFSWIRLSLDAASEGIYTLFRGKPMFWRVIKNFLAYLEYDVKYVGIGFLFARANVQDYAKVARLIFDIVKQEKPHALYKVNIQYRPLQRDPSSYGKSFTQAVISQQVSNAVREVRELADSSSAIKAFLKDQTNITAILGGNFHSPHEFSRCYYSQTFRMVRASGDLRPCCIRVSGQDFSLGNIKTDSLEKIALNTIFIGARRKADCNAHGCRRCHINHTLDQGLKGTLQPSVSPEVLADLMY